MNRFVSPAVRPLLMGASLIVATLLQGQTPPPPGLPTVEVMATDPTALVGTSSGAFTFVRTGSTDADLTVAFTLGGNATNGVDYRQIKPSNPTVTIPAGYAAVDLAVQPLVNPARHGNSSVVVKLTPGDPAGFELGKHHRSAEVRIIDNALEEPLPSVTLTNPPDGSTFSLPVVVPLGASVTDTGNDMAFVSFFLDDRVIGRITNAPYVLTLTNPPVGNHELYARAVDEAGKSALSAPVHITVVDPKRPNVKLLSPVNLTRLGIGTPIAITADGSGLAPYVLTLTGNGKVLTQATNTSPLTFVWKDLPPGEYTIVARVRDGAGQLASAIAVAFITNAPPEVTVTSPKDGANFAANSTIPLAATATDIDDKVAQVVFFVDAVPAGKPIKENPYTMDLAGLKPGFHTIYAVATDQFGLRQRSATVRISVSH